MQDPNASKPGEIGELKKALLGRLSKRTADIAEIWYTLSQINWDPDRLSKLHRHIKDLAADSGKFGLVPLTESLSSLDICLAPYLGSVTGLAANPMNRIPSPTGGPFRTSR